MNRNGMALVLFIAFMLPAVTNAETSVSGCSTLNTAGETYILTQDISDSSASVCMDIRANDVTLDCQGHIIDGTGKSLSKGVAKNYGYSGMRAAIKNCVLSNWYYSVYINSADAVSVTDNRIEDSLYGIILQAAPGSLVTKNEITRYLLEGITLRRSNTTTVTSNRLWNSMEGYNAKGIMSGEGNHLLIQDNEITDFSGWGIYLYDLIEGGNNLILRNVIRNTKIYPNVGSGGIFVLDRNGAEIKNNVMENSVLGIYVEGSNFTISENETFKNQTGIWITWPWLEPGSTASTVQDNIVYDNASAGIVITSNENKVTGNSVYRNGTGLSASGERNEIRNNTLYENYWGMELSLSNAVIDGNTIKDSTYYGMRFVSGSGMTITGNTVCGSEWDMYVSPQYPIEEYSATGNRCETVLGWHDDGVKSGCSSQCNNTPPIAEAGPDQTVQCSGSGASVRLDGSGSRDPDNNPLKYAWTWQGGSAEGVSPSITLPLGTTRATLTVDDGNGGKDSDTVNVTVQDTISPVTTVRSITGIAGDNGWYRSDVVIAVESTDTCSGVREIRSTVDGVAATTPGNTATISVKSDLLHNVSFNAADNAGTVEQPQVLTVKIDQTQPLITALVSPAPNAQGWHNTDVTVTFTCSDLLSGVAICPAPITVTTEGAGQIITGTASDKAGNSATASVVLNIDKTPPAVNLSASPGMLWPPNHKMVNVMMNGDATDPVSGVASAVFTVVDEYGQVQPVMNGFNTAIPLEAWREGNDMDGRHYTITAVITDKAGNQTAASVVVVVPHDMGW